MKKSEKLNFAQLVLKMDRLKYMFNDALIVDIDCYTQSIYKNNTIKIYNLNDPLNPILIVSIDAQSKIDYKNNIIDRFIYTLLYR